MMMQDIDNSKYIELLNNMISLKFRIQKCLVYYNHNDFPNVVVENLELSVRNLIMFARLGPIIFKKYRSLIRTTNIPGLHSDSIGHKQRNILQI